MNKTALITGVTGQDGSYLMDLLLEKNYKVVGLYRRSSNNNFQRIQHALHNENLILEEFDITDPANVTRVVSKYTPDEFYNLAAQSHVATSFSQPSTTFDINTTGVVNVLEAIRQYSSSTKVYQASTSEMFGRSYSVRHDGSKYQNEETELLPQSPYGVSKLASHRMIQIYRSGYGLFTTSGILFNHESPRRGENFVTRKITKYIGQVVNGHNIGHLKLGNLSAHRDWGHAKDYVNAMWMMLQEAVADDYVICTGKTWSVYDFLKAAFDSVNLNYKDYVEIDESLYRPAEVEYLCGTNTKAVEKLGWKPQYTFQDLVNEMVQADINMSKG